ncbi:ABC transporter permease [Methanofollis sp. UBA420]|jgi:ABC-2 type transport system permease protein|uniref:ABC transporter permease n=1 Tax=Methanofollis sp. UBA420 TaxID=1915514 RepID=UPI00316ACB10
MVAERVFIVARKEFADHLTGRKFLVILAFFLMFALAGMQQGIDRYNQNLESYNEQVQLAEDAAGPAGVMPERPSVLFILSALLNSLVVFGGILAIAIGFDLVSKEKETRTLQMLLSHPVYRDEVINGKALGGSAALGVALALAFAVTLAVLLLLSIVPTPGEFVSIGVIGIVYFLFLLAVFTLALFLSVVVKESGHAVVYGLALFLALSYVLPLFGTSLGDAVAGEMPQMPEMPIDGRDADGVIYISSDPAALEAYEEECDRYDQEMETYQAKKRFVTDSVNFFSPVASCCAVTSTVIYPSDMPPEDAAGRIWGGIAALVVFASVFFALAYGKFMRMDLR